MKLLGAYNCLINDPFYETNQVFILNAENDSIYQALDRSAEGREPDIAEVWTSPEPPSLASGQLQNGEYNPSVSFASTDRAFFTDGRGTLYILKTGNRANHPFGNQWGTSFKDDVCGKRRSFSVVSSLCYQKTLHCLLQYVEERDKVLSGNKTQEAMPKVNFVNVIEWMTFVETDDGWTLDRVRKFAFYGGIDYIELHNAFEKKERRDGAYLLCITDKPFILTYDSAGAILEEEQEEVARM